MRNPLPSISCSFPQLSETPILLVSMEQQYGLSFCQTLQHDFSNLLKVPEEVVRKFGIVPQKYKIKGPRKMFWDVSVEAIGNDLYFRQGWSALAYDLSLKEEDLLLFKQCGASEFSVKVFGQNGIEEVFTLTEEEEEEEQQQQQEEEEEEIIIVKEEPVFHEPRVKKERAKRSTYPSFSVVMTASCVTTAYQMNVQAGFARKHLEGKQSLKLRVDGRTRSWTVEVKQKPPYSTYLRGGWINFARDNDLREGDVCFFSLVENGTELVMDVSIIRK